MVLLKHCWFRTSQVSASDVDIYLVTNTGDDVYLIRNAPVPGGGSLGGHRRIQDYPRVK